MKAVAKKFRPLIEGSLWRLKQNIVSFQSAKPAPPCWWIEWWCSLLSTPCDGVWSATLSLCGSWELWSHCCHPPPAPCVVCALLWIPLCNQYMFPLFQSLFGSLCICRLHYCSCICQAWGSLLCPGSYKKGLPSSQVLCLSDLNVVVNFVVNVLVNC